MNLGFLRMTAVLVLLLAVATFSFCPTVAAALVETQAVDRCCGADRDEPERPAPASDCAAAECSCVTCVVVLLSTPFLELSSRILNDPHPPVKANQPPAGYLASIDYPPENV